MRNLVPLAAALVLSSCASPTPYTGGIDPDLDRRIARELRGGSMVVAVVEGGEITRFAGFGTVEVGAQILPDAHTTYRIGSVSKLLTATTVMRLQEEGLLDIDAPVTDVLTDFRLAVEPARPITPRDLLTHRAGLPSNLAPGMFSDAPGAPEALLDALAEQEPIHAPGAWWAYSNPGFGLLGLTVQEASGQPFEQAVSERIFEPLGMTGASWDMTDSIPPVQDGVLADEGIGISMPAAGSATLSVTDLAAFASGLMHEGDGALLEPTTLEQMWTRQDVGALSGDFPMGLGFSVQDEVIEGSTVVGHTGETLYFTTHLTMVPDRDTAILVLTNEGTARGLAAEVAHETLRVATGVEAPGEDRAAEVDKGALTEVELDALAGLYATPSGPLDLRRSGRALVGELRGQALRFVPAEGGVLRASAVAFGVVSQRIPGAEFRVTEIDGVTLLQQRPAGAAWTTLGSKVPASGEDHGWGTRVGTWSRIGDDASDKLRFPSATLETQGEHLFLTLHSTPEELGMDIEAVLIPLDAERARIAGIGRGLGDVVTVRDGVLSVKGLTFE